MLDKEFFNRETNITAKVVCDSINEQGVRLTTFEIEYPRIVMSEFNTHRSVSKNSSSSRAIPVSKMLGHTNTRMTAHYAKLVDESIAKQMDQIVDLFD